MPLVANGSLASESVRKSARNGIRIPPRRRKRPPAPRICSRVTQRRVRRGVGGHAAASAAWSANAAARIAALGDRVAFELVHDRPAAHDEHAVREADDLLELGGDEDDPDALRRELGEEVVDRALGADVDAARRLVGEQDARLAEQHPREEDLLLVPARERVDRRPVARAAHLAALEHRARRLAARARRRTTPRTLNSREPRRASRSRSTERPKISPSSFRDSGIIATPASRLRRGFRASLRARGENGLPRLAPARRRRSSARAPCARRPTRPASPRISPCAQLEARRPRRRARRGRAPSSTTGASAGGAAFGGNVAVSGRPSIASISEASVSDAVGAVFTSLPSRSTVTVSASSSTSFEEVRDEDDRLARGGEPADDLVQMSPSRARRAPRSARP